MYTSESISNLSPALLAAQREMGHPKRNAKNPHLRNQFADLPCVIDTVKEVLNKHDIVVVQSVHGSGEASVPYAGVKTRLIHGPSGEWIEDSIDQAVDAPKGMNVSQAIGSAITYLRRYSLSAMACVASEPDDDGNEAKGQPSKPNPTTDLDL